MTRTTKPTLKPKAEAKAKVQKPAPPPTLTVHGAVKSLHDLMRRSNCARALQYVPELAWIFFLRFLDEREASEAAAAEARGVPFAPALAAPYRWRDWAAPEAPLRSGRKAKVEKFVQQSLLPALKALKEQSDATPRQKLVSEIVASVDRSRIDSEPTFLEVLDIVHEIGRATVDETQLFTHTSGDLALAKVFDGLLLKLGAKVHDGGQFFTPPAVVRAMVRVLGPRLGKTVYDPGCGTGAFLVEAGEAMRAQAGDAITSADLDTLRRRTFYGREKDATVYPVALANLALHGIDEPHLAHGDGVSPEAEQAGLPAGAPDFFDYVLMNVARGGPEGKEALMPDDSHMNATQALQHVRQCMKSGSRCGLVLDDGVLRDTEALSPAKQQLLEECDVHCIVALPGGLFPSADAGARMDLVFFDKGRATERIWYYDLTDVPVGKKTPLSPEHFEEFFRLLPERADSERSWTVDFAARLQSALEGARPHREAAASATARAKLLEEAIMEERAMPVATPDEARALEEQWQTALQEARVADAKAARIEQAVYDLRPVKPRRQAAVKVDDARLAHLLVVLEEQGQAVDSALARLQALLGQE